MGATRWATVGLRGLHDSPLDLRACTPRLTEARVPFQTGGCSPEPSTRSGCLCIRLLPGYRGPWNSGMSAAAPAFQLVAGSVVPLSLAVTGTAHASFVHTEHAPPSEPGRPPVRHPTCLSAPLHCGRGQLRTSVCALAVLREAWGPSASWSPLPCPGQRACYKVCASPIPSALRVRE